ncbi:MAG TPA: DsbE family thiol:disulfide interchange protein [Alphaproteobacteria bacterium]|nr:DsbE family thiol:disulfide interchange protein [Alphaproteobacteria bacterium]
MKTLRHLPYLIPLALFAVLAGFMTWRLVLIAQGDTPNYIPSVTVGKPAPPFDLPPLYTGKPRFTSADLKGKVTLIDFFASWCVACRAEHPLLAGIKGHGAVLIGIAYKDKPQAAKAWLAKMGDPYDEVVTDAQGRTAIDFGLYGVPESYLIDKNGIIRMKETGPLTPEVIRDDLLPAIAVLNR